MDLIYKIASVAAWRDAESKGRFDGAAIDLSDGFIHFSTVAQVRETAAKHFAGQEDLLLIAVDPQQLAADLRWEISRGGAMFPHLYAALPLTAVKWAKPMLLGADGLHDFTDLLT